MQLSCFGEILHTHLILTHCVICLEESKYASENICCCHMFDCCFFPKIWLKYLNKNFVKCTGAMAFKNTSWTKCHFNVDIHEMKNERYHYHILTTIFILPHPSSNCYNCTGSGMAGQFRTYWHNGITRTTYCHTFTGSILQLEIKIPEVVSTTN